MWGMNPECPLPSEIDTTRQASFAPHAANLATSSAGVKKALEMLRGLADVSRRAVTAHVRHASNAKPATHLAPAFDVLTGIAKWEIKATGLEKAFGFRNSATAERFRAQAEDLKSRARRPFEINPGSSSVELRISIPPEADSHELADEQLALASAVDDIGSQLQLQGGWG